VGRPSPNRGISGRDTDHGGRPIVHSHRLASHWLAIQAITPEGMAHDDDRLGVGSLVRFDEYSPQRRSIAKLREPIG
jgi:hypothetical protein